jgi:hypothetical protein
MPDRKIIDLQTALTSRDSEVLAGHDRGKYYREKFALDTCDGDDQSYDILVPERISAINLSFFLSMFGQSIIKLGPHNFAEKYKFIGRASVLRTVEQGVSRAAKSIDPKRSA